MGGSVPADVFEAAYRVAHDFGVQKLAALMGMPAGVLYNKLNTHESSHHKLTLADTIQISVNTRDHRILHALAHTLGEVCFPVPNLSHVSDAALLELITQIGAEGGDFYRAVNEALADGQFTKKEFRRIEAEALEYIGAIVETTARIKGLVDE